MEKQVGTKFVWVIKDFSTLQCEKCCSLPIQIGDCKWRLIAHPRGNNCGYLSLFLEVVDFESLPTGWRRYVKLRLGIAKQFSEEPSLMKEAHRWFDPKVSCGWGFPSMIQLTKLHNKNEGFIVNGELMIVAEVDILQVVGTLEESGETNPGRKLMVESISSVSVRQQDMTVGFRRKNQQLKTACMNVLLCLTQTLCQTPQELSVDDLLEAEKTLAYMKGLGFEVDWLGKKLVEVKEKKKKKEKEKSC